MRAPARILHLHGSFDLGGKEARAVRLMNAFGDAAHHTVLSAVPGALGARDAIAPGIAADFPGAAAPALHGKPGPLRYWRLARYMRGFDLVLSYNWGAMDAVMARRLFSRVMNLPPLIHHEDGFNEDERKRRNWKRDAFRRLALPTARHLMVPSQTLRKIARGAWRCPDARILTFDNGVALAAYARADLPPPPLAKASGDIWVGTIAGLRAVKNLPALVRALAYTADPRLHLVIAGEGPERAAILAEAECAGLAGRVHLIGFCPRPPDIVGHFDIFALSSFSEQQPIGLIEAMAAARPTACYAVGDIEGMTAAENRPYIVAPGDESALAQAIATLVADSGLRERIGRANRVVAEARFGESAMIERFRSIYGEAMDRADFARH